MCGIAGFWSTKKISDPLATLAAMGNRIAHRGPDDSGAWFDPATGVGLAHRRLSIVDLSQAGHQPMFSASGRYCIVFNGEVYNAEELRDQLPQQPWRGHSDTEVMLAAFEHWGVQPAVERFVGMFAFALWDRQERRLYLIRDRLGIKPLYYGLCGTNTLLFGSELKAFHAHPEFEVGVNRDSLSLFLRYSYIPAPHTIYSGIRKLPPGTIAMFSNAPAREPLLTAYWSARAVAESGLQNQFAGSEDEAVAELDALLRRAIRLRMIADVPLGAFLSGGIDSSTVVALMQAISSRPVRTYTIGFEERAYDESEPAKQVAAHLGTDHTEVLLGPQQAMQAIPQLPEYYDEPFADASQLPTLLVSQLARSQVTVALSGDGGDELFGGYTRYAYLPRVLDFNRRMPQVARHGLSRTIQAFPARYWDASAEVVNALLPSRMRLRALGSKAHKLAPLLLLNEPEDLYRRVISAWADPTTVARASREPKVMVTESRELLRSDLVSQMMYLDLCSYLPDDVLTKVDRASMAVSLEARVPLLDHRVVEFAWRLPQMWKVHNGASKKLLRRVLAKYVPEKLFHRPKAGFSVPVGSWLRGQLRDWAEALLDSSRLRQEGFFVPSTVRNAWEEHVRGCGDWQQRLWCILMFQAWLENQHSVTGRGTLTSNENIRNLTGATLDVGAAV